MQLAHFKDYMTRKTTASNQLCTLSNVSNCIYLNQTYFEATRSMTHRTHFRHKLNKNITKPWLI